MVASFGTISMERGNSDGIEASVGANVESNPIRPARSSLHWACARLLARDGVNAKAEGRRYCRVSSERQEAPGHCVGKLAITRQVGGQAVVAQIHQTGIRPKPSERRLDRRNRMFQGMDESDAHLV
jgi:hypothetical protein